MQARFYLPQYHRFTAPDPMMDQHIEDPQSLHLYTYCENQPVTRIDPTGMTRFDLWGKDQANQNASATRAFGSLTPSGDGYKQSTTASGSQAGLAVKTDAQGNVIFDATSQGHATFMKDAPVGNGDKVSIGWDVTQGNVYALDGAKIQASKNGPMEVTLTKADGTVVKGGSEMLPQGFSNKTDCHGTTFAGGQVWINNDQVGKLLAHSGFKQTASSAAGNVGVYSVGGSIVHSVTSVGGGNVYSKGGITAGAVVPAGPGPGTGWVDPSATLTWYTR